MNVFVALADSTRRRIVEMLARGPLSAGEIAVRFPITPSAISQHLKVLKTARLVTVRRESQQRIYALDPAGLVEIDSWLNHIGPVWQERIEAIERLRRLEASLLTLNR